jgi:hypothetical protein
MAMIHKAELLDAWKLCRENATPGKIEPLVYAGCSAMYWDVVEVKPEPGYCLFVRFKDGLNGRVRLRDEDLTGVLAPLRNGGLFEQVFIDDGAVAWPGDIDLAPDAMYEDIAAQALSVANEREHSHR